MLSKIPIVRSRFHSFRVDHVDQESTHLLSCIITLSNLIDLHMSSPDSWPRGVLKFGLVGHVPLAAQDPYPFSGVIFSKNRYPNVGIFLKKLPFSCDFATKTHQIFKIFRGSPEILKIRPIVGDFFFSWKMGPMFRDFVQKTDPKLQHIPVCLNMWVPPGQLTSYSSSLSLTNWVLPSDSLWPFRWFHKWCSSKSPDSNLDLTSSLETLCMGKRQEVNMLLIFYYFGMNDDDVL